MILLILDTIFYNCLIANRKRQVEFKPNKIIKRALESLDTNQIHLMIGFTQNKKKHFLILQTSINLKIITDIKFLTSFFYISSLTAVDLSRRGN